MKFPHNRCAIIVYWRRLNDALSAAGLPLADLGEAWAAYQSTHVGG